MTRLRAGAWLAAALAALWLCAPGFGAAVVAAQEPGTQEPGMVAGFVAEAGDKALATVRRIKRQPRLQAMGIEVVAVSSYQVEVLERLADGYVVRWALVDTRLEGAPPEMTDALKALLADVAVPVEFETDARGAPIRVRDREALQEKVYQALLDIGGEEAAKGLEAARRMMSAMDDASFAALMGRNAALLAFGQSAEPRPFGETERAEERGNPFGGAPIQAAVRQTLAAGEPADLAAFSWTAEFDEAALQRQLVDGLRQMAERAGRDPAEVDRQFKSMTLVFDETGESQIGVQDGWARSVRFERRQIVLAAGQTRDQSESVVIALTRAEK